MEQKHHDGREGGVFVEHSSIALIPEEKTPEFRELQPNCQGALGFSGQLELALTLSVLPFLENSPLWFSLVTK